MQEKTGGLSGGSEQDSQILKGWLIDCKHIQSGGLIGEKTATKEELLEVCELLELDEMVSLSCHYDFAPYAKGRYVLTCTFSAELKQKSIYSLELVVQKISSDFVTELFQRRDEDEGGQFYLRDGGDVLDDADQDFFNGEVIELGRLVFEFLSLELDRFSQDEGDSDEWREQHKKAKQAQDIKLSPFAALQSLSQDKKQKK